jgi:3-oxoacid CoA-transferase subunit A
MVIITGDTHRDFDRVEDFCVEFETTPEDVLVILGDAGINYGGEPYDRELKEKLSQYPVTLLCIHGNHEMRPESIASYEETQWRGGIVYWEPEFPNLLFAKDGEIYELEGKRCMAIGGAYSVDKYSRRPFVSWWPDEQPSDDIKDRVEERLQKENWNVDVVFSHTCPYKYLPREDFLGFIDQNSVDNSTEEWLDTIEDTLTYAMWYCGHFHADKFSGGVRIVFEDFLELRF